MHSNSERLEPSDRSAIVDRALAIENPEIRSNVIRGIAESLDGIQEQYQHDVVNSTADMPNGSFATVVALVALGENLEHLSERDRTTIYTRMLELSNPEGKARAIMALLKKLECLKPEERQGLEDSALALIKTPNLSSLVKRNLMSALWKGLN
jgi:hypothetical protein